MAHRGATCKHRGDAGKRTASAIMDPARWRIFGSPNRLLLDFDARRPVKSPSGSRKITGGSRVWPTHGPRDPRAFTRTLLISGYRFGLTTPGSSPRLPGLHMGCRMQRPATDKPASGWAVRASFR